MKQSFCIFSRVIPVVLILLGLCSAVFAAPSEEILTELERLQAEQERIAADKAELEAELSRTDAQMTTYAAQKAQIDQELELNRQSVENLNAQLHQHSLLIAQTQEQLDALNAELEALLGQFRLRMRTMQEQGEVPLWAVVFQSASFSEMLNRSVMVEEIAKADQRMMAKLRTLSAEVLDTKQALADEKAQLALKKEELAEAEKALEESRVEAEQMLLTLAADKEAMRQELEASERLEEEMIAQIAALEAEYNAQKRREEEEKRREEEQQKPDAPTTAPDDEPDTPTESSFLFPLDPSGFQMITDAYGYRIHPITGNYSLHNGVDLAAYQGTTVYAAKSGTVTIADYSYALGNYVVINHGDDFSTMYAHMTHFTVSVGDSVGQGQTIGYVGSTGVYSTGPHLHFTVYLDGGTVNPMNYLSLP